MKTQTALATIVEVGDFKRFPSAERFASYIGLVPGEDSSGGDQNRLGITKAGNRHVRMLLVEATQSFSRGKIGYKSAALKQRQAGNAPEVIAYADRANERLRRKYYKMVLGQNKRSNVAKTGCCKKTELLYLGYDDRQYCVRYRSVHVMSRLLRTADAAPALTFPARCDSG